MTTDLYHNNGARHKNEAHTAEIEKKLRENNGS